MILGQNGFSEKYQMLLIEGDKNGMFSIKKAAMAGRFADFLPDIIS